MHRDFPPGTTPARGFQWDRVLFPPRRVGDFADLSYGRSLVEGKRKPGKVPVYGTNGPCGSHNEGLELGPGLILGRKGQGPLGVEWCDGPFWVIDTAYFASVNPDVDLKWFYYIVKYVGLNHLKSGEKPGLQRDTFRAQMFPFPEKDVQTDIALVLSALDDKIAANRDVNATLEALSSALFNSWFVDFDPVVAKRDGKAPVGVPAEAIDLFPNHFENSEVGPIPLGWRATRVDEAFELNPKRELARGEVAPYLEMADLPTAGHSPEAWVRRATGSGMRFVNGDTLMARITPCLENGKTAFVDLLEEGEVGWGSTEYIVIRSKLPMPLPASYLLARNEDFRAFAIQGMTGSSGRQRVGADVLGSYKLALPSDPRVLKAFGTVVEPFFRMAQASCSESRALAELRDALVGPLLSGDLTVKAAEKAAGAAL